VHKQSNKSKLAHLSDEGRTSTSVPETSLTVWKARFTISERWKDHPIRELVMQTSDFYCDVEDCLEKVHSGEKDSDRVLYQLRVIQVFTFWIQKALEVAVIEHKELLSLMDYKMRDVSYQEIDLSDMVQPTIERVRQCFESGADGDMEGCSQIMKKRCQTLSISLSKSNNDDTAAATITLKDNLSQLIDGYQGNEELIALIDSFEEDKVRFHKHLTGAIKHCWQTIHMSVYHRDEN
jgi:hypothetical protein